MTNNAVKLFDRYYATRVLYLLIMPFTKQKAFSLGIIDKDGNKLREPKPDESQYYDELHKICFEVKKLLNKTPSSELRLKIVAVSLQLLGRRNVPEMFLDGLVMEATRLMDENISLIVEETIIESLLSQLPLFEEGEGVGVPATTTAGIEPHGEPVIDPKKKSSSEIFKRKELTESVTEPIYVSRRLINSEEFIKWFKDQGFEETVNPDDLHVTVCYSNKAVDSTNIHVDDQKLNVSTEGRSVEPLGDDGAVVMKFSSKMLQARWKYYMRMGCSHDYESYQPHVTITYKNPNIDLSKVKPFEGTLEFDKEVLEPLDTEWSEKVEHS